MDIQDKQFKDLMKNYQPAKAPGGFSMKVMEEIQATESSVSEYKPVFGKWSVRFMIAAFASLVIYILSTGNSGSEETPSIISPYLEKLPQADLSFLSQFTQSIGEIYVGVPSVVIFTLVAATLLLMLDILVLKKRRRSLAV